jgi:hypothetical protein
MANIISVRKGRTITTVTIADVPNVQCDIYVTRLAMEAAGETPVTLFGANVKFFDEDDLGITAVVDLYTD